MEASSARARQAGGVLGVYCDSRVWNRRAISEVVGSAKHRQNAMAEASTLGEIALVEHLIIQDRL
jgi:hypothetical protein